MSRYLHRSWYTLKVERGDATLFSCLHKPSPEHYFVKTHVSVVNCSTSDIVLIEYALEDNHNYKWGESEKW